MIVARAPMPPKLRALMVKKKTLVQLPEFQYNIISFFTVHMIRNNNNYYYLMQCIVSTFFSATACTATQISIVITCMHV